MFLVSDLEVTLSGRRVLQIPFLQFPDCGLVSVIGPNGAGKSTLVRVLARLHPGFRGHITVGGESIRSLVPRHYGRMVSYVSQELDRSCGYTSREVLLMGRYPHQGRYFDGEKSINELWQHTVNSYNLSELLDRRVSGLSAGERQKIFIASSVIQETGCILLDEPTSALDVREGENLFQLLRFEVEHKRKLVICVTHDLNGALVHSDRILALKNGNVEFWGSPEECSRAKIIRRTFGISPLEVSHPHKPVSMVIPGFASTGETLLK